MNRYYYLISSLYDLMVDDTKSVIELQTFLDFCQEELECTDYNSLKLLFIFNDMRNAVEFKNEEDPFYTPAFYSQAEFMEGLRDTDQFLPFLSEYYYLKKTEKRLNPELQEIDELVLLFYQSLDQIKDRFVRDYFLFELDLQNITTALSLKRSNLEFHNKIIPYGENYDKLLKSNSHDFNLTGDIFYIDTLVEVYDSNDSLKIEKTIEDIRWQWLDERTESTSFTAQNVFSYAVKLKSVERWKGLTDDKGKTVLDNLINKIKASIKFSEEFLTIGGKKS